MRIAFFARKWHSSAFGVFLDVGADAVVSVHDVERDWVHWTAKCLLIQATGSVAIEICPSDPSSFNGQLTKVAHFVPDQLPFDMPLSLVRAPAARRTPLSASGNLRGGGDVWSEARGD